MATIDRPTPTRGDWLLWIAGLATIVIAAIAVISYVNETVGAKLAGSLSIVLTNASALVVIPILVFVSIHLRPEDTDWRRGAAINFIAMATGAILGWALAVFWVPFDEVDRRLYSEIGATVTLILSGYAFAKFDRLLTYMVGDEKSGPNPKFVTPLLLGLAALSYAAVVVITNRVDYVQREAGCEKATGELKARCREAVVARAEKLVNKAEADLELAAAALNNARRTLDIAKRGIP